MSRASTEAGQSAAASTPGSAERPGAFVTTHWSVVFSASHSESSGARAALERLCQTYWYPLYSYVRRRGHSPEDAQDLTQEFFARLLEHNWVARADRAKGRFRSFLLMALNRFLANEWDKLKTQKRGGQVRLVPLGLDTAEGRYECEPATTTTPEVEFEQQWAVTLLEAVLRGLREDYADKTVLFDALKPCLIGSREMQPYAELASRLGMSEGAVKVAVSRLRQRYRERLREEIVRTVATAAEVEEELRHLFHVLARR